MSEKVKSTGILELTLESLNAEHACSGIKRNSQYLCSAECVEYKSAESQKTLEFLDKQLPILKDQLEAASSILNDFRNKRSGRLKY